MSSHSVVVVAGRLQTVRWRLIGSNVPAVILILRTYAVWGQNKKVLLFMGLFFCAIFFTNISVLVVFLKYLQFGPLPSPTIPGCNTVKSSDILGIVWILLILHETVILFLTLYQGLKHLRYCRGRLWVTLFTDGIIYYLLFLVNMIANVIILFGLPVQYSDFLNPFQGVIHSVLSCRVILNLRAAGSRQDSLLGETSQSLQFAMQQRAGTTSSSSTSTVVQIANSRNIDEEHGVDDQT
ncbi:hypothetical protein SERLA73DRAFT_70511 [Serpula lacrymans var. lacrymans S7.3]|uniref:Uncharacterized protein n=1 Tax=Serpula lacrymans var. lacrymans (strain S7.3) TaxID=936435 RepID=F8PN68_SERL3|nr:hypothetical protein SERLA73DRAFT_70511 [Serpula lacrymans var. lacrymans S7.3]